MVKRIAGWLNVYEKEIGLTLWTIGLLFLVRSSGIILNNYAETAFLKRYGVQFLPVVNMINAVVTVFVMGFMAALMQRFSDSGLLVALFIFCGVSVAGLRLLIPFGIELIYPVLFMLKALYEVLLAMLFWNLANELFNSRQSKRLFPLITAGGVVGQILGSFGTPWIARWLKFDNLLIVYLGVSLAGAALVRAMMARYPVLLIPGQKPGKPRRKSSMLDEIRATLPIVKESKLMRLMILLTFMPNVVIPILNYQFNFAVNSQFATESTMVAFFGYFRGGLNVISLIILLFVGKIYGRWGLPVALMFHPLNYIVAFMAFFLRFDVFSAAYARLSTNILRTTINTPAQAILIGLFPESYRSAVRPFLRGTVVRVALFLGSGLILLSGNVFHPRYLSLVALPFVLAWVLAPFLLKRNYAGILLDLMQRNQLDLKSLEAKDIGQLFHDRRTQSHVLDAFHKAGARDALWLARLLRQTTVPNLDAHLLKKVRSLLPEQQIALLGLLSEQVDAQALPVLTELAGAGHPGLTLAVLDAVDRMTPETAARFDRQPYLNDPVAAVRAHAVAGMPDQTPETLHRIIGAWLEDADMTSREAGVIAAGRSREASFTPALMAILADSGQNRLVPEVLKALHQIIPGRIREVVQPYLAHADSKVRAAALGAYDIFDKESLEQVISLLGDPVTDIRRMAVEHIADAEFQDGKTLIKHLHTAKRDVRENLFELLDRLQIKAIDAFRFVRSQIIGAYRYLAEATGVDQLLPAGACRELLESHLNQQKEARIENVLRVLAAQDPTGRLRVIWWGLMSGDRRQRANSSEALDNLVDRRLSVLLLPLIEESSRESVLAQGRRHFKSIPRHEDRDGLIAHLLGRSDWLTVCLTLGVIAEAKTLNAPREALARLLSSPHRPVRRLARQQAEAELDFTPRKEHVMVDTLTLPDIILRLRRIDIFEGLPVSELAAVASVTREEPFEPGRVVITEGDPGDTLYLVIEGEVSVTKRQADGGQLELDRIGAGDYFGEMALFEDIPRTASVASVQPSRLLVLTKQDFKEMVREYPQIALEICKVLSARIRHLHAKVTQGPSAAPVATQPIEEKK